MSTSALHAPPPRLIGTRHSSDSHGIVRLSRCPIVVNRYELASIRFGFFFFSSRRRHTRFKCDWSSDVCSRSVQGATDLEVLYHELPGYLPMPLRDAHPDLKPYLEKETPKGGFWVNRPKFLVSLLKAFYGSSATKDNEFGYQWLPKRASADAYSHQHTFVDMYKAKIKGVVCDGQNPAVGGPNAKLARAAMHRLDSLVAVGIFN